jgi:ligand-binding SRPBCC domain-containing protein
MSAHVLERRQRVGGDLDRVFAFFEDPLNLEAITPPWLHFEVTGSTDARVRLGTEIDYRLRWQVFPMRWRSRITEHQPGVLFADEMLVGPYRRWYHRHLFTPAEGGVEMVDIVEYELPYGPLGAFVHAALIRGQLQAIFDYRRDAIARIFSS